MGNIENIRIVVKLLKAHNIRYIVISPGGTNVEFVKMIQDDSFFKCFSVVDERSAMYFAIGLFLQTGEVIATSCTSAQATRNYIPGLTEAYYKRVPILAITMAKHNRFVGQEYMQAPNQTSLPVDCVKKSYMLPYITDDNDFLFSKRLINEAILELSKDGYGPVQLCIPWVDFKLNPINKRVSAIKKHNNLDGVNLSKKKILIVIGEHRPFNEMETNTIEKFCEVHDCVIYVNHLSNYSGKFVVKANLELSSLSLDEFISGYLPDILITIGGQTGDYPLYRIISDARNENFVHWRICEDGAVVDTYDKLSDVFQMTIMDFFKTKIKEPCSHDYYQKWSHLVNNKVLNMKLPFSNAYIAQKLHNHLPKNSIIQFSILNSLRIWNLFPLDDSIQCFSNVAAFGIDGGMSTLIGQSVVTENICYMIIGDLAFYYDMNSIGIRHIKNNVKIIIINNNGGVEFKLSKQENKKTDEFIAAGNHFRNAAGWAKTCGFDYYKITNKEDYLKNYDVLLSKNDRPTIFEVFVSDVDEADAYHKILECNRRYSLKSILKKAVKKIIN